MTTISVVKLFSLSKQGIENFAYETIEQVKSGNQNALELEAYLTAIENTCALIKKGIKAEAEREFDKYGQTSIDTMGLNISQREMGVRYDFSKCNDVSLNVINGKIVQLNEVKKQREEFLKALKEPMTIVDDETGEIIKVTPPIKTSTTSRAYSFK